MRKNYFFIVIFLITALSVGCKKKDRLSSPGFVFSITPSAATMLKNENRTLIAQTHSAAGSTTVAPTWTVSDSSIGTLDTFFGAEVVFTASALGDVTVTALFNGNLATTGIAIVTFRPNSNTFDIYIDDGLPTDGDVESDIFTFPSIGVSLTELSSGYTTEGELYMRGNDFAAGQSWSVNMDKNNTGKNLDLSSFNSGNLKFSIRLSRTLGLETIQVIAGDTTGTQNSILSSDTVNFGGFSRVNTNWQEITVPISALTAGIDITRVEVPFAIGMVSLFSSLTFDIDAVRWEK